MTIQVEAGSCAGSTGDPCPVRDVIERVGDKWSVLLIHRLAGGPRRFGVLARTVEGISRNMLARTLRLLERDGLVSRTVHPTVPPTVEYALTDLGHSLVPPLNALSAWAVEYGERVRASRTDFDRRHGAAGAAVSGVSDAPGSGRSA